MDILRFFFKNRQKSAAQTQEKYADEPSHSLREIHSDDVNSHLLKEILSETPDAPVVELPVLENKTKGYTSLSLRLNIGGRLAESRANILTQIAALMSLADKETASVLEDWRAHIEQQSCRIAFVGQINAGKSSLISSLVEQPDLLPASINPWTTVITNIYFGVPGQPEAGASFVFFTADEWRRLSKGGRVRELTDRAFPNFDWLALEEQIEIMKARAEAKLGPRVHSLLGTTHSHPEAGPDLLVRYVGAGSEANDGPRGPEGEFSDITKLANVYFDLGPFLFPTVLIDTPGINDPFLVRDEITRQCLDDVDVCVVVVTAKQPLSTSDLGLLRLLIGLDKRKVLIFVNKVDEIEASSGALVQIEGTIRALLHAEFPGHEFPVVFGSALWAREAIAGSDAPAGGTQARREASVFRSLQAIEPWLDPANYENAILPSRRMTQSGLLQLAVTISDLVRGGSVAELLEHKAAILEQLCKNLISCRKLAGAAGPIDAGGEHPIDAQDLQKLMHLRDAVLDTLAPWHQVFDGLLAENFAALQSTLAASLHEGIASSLAELPDLRAHSQLRNADRNIRRQLQATFTQAHSGIITAFRTRLTDFVRQLQQTVDDHAVPLTVIVPTTVDYLLQRPLSAAALNEPAALDLTERFGDNGLGSIPGGQVKDVVAYALTANFEPIIAKLTLRGEKSLKSVAEDVLLQIRLTLVKPLETLIDHITQAALHTAASGPVNGSAAVTHLDTAEALKQIESLAAIKQVLASARLLLQDSS